MEKLKNNPPQGSRRRAHRATAWWRSVSAWPAAGVCMLAGTALAGDGFGQIDGKIVLWLFAMIAVVAMLTVWALVAVMLQGRRVSGLAERSAGAPLPAGPSMAAITQSREFCDAVRQMIHMELERHRTAGRAPRASAAAAVEASAPQPATPDDAALTETELALLFDLMEAAQFRMENSVGKAALCTIFLSEINQQYQQNYTPGDCDAMARKVVWLTRGEKDALLSQGKFIQVRHVRGNVAVDFDARAAEPLQTLFEQGE